MTTLDQEAVRRTVANTKIEDFLDGLEYYSAEKAKCPCIITYDRNDFLFGEIEVLDAEDFLVRHVLPLNKKSRK